MTNFFQIAWIIKISLPSGVPPHNSTQHNTLKFSSKILLCGIFFFFFDHVEEISGKAERRSRENRNKGNTRLHGKGGISDWGETRGTTPMLQNRHLGFGLDLLNKDCFFNLRNRSCACFVVLLLHFFELECVRGNVRYFNTKKMLKF